MSAKKIQTPKITPELLAELFAQQAQNEEDAHEARTAPAVALLVDNGAGPEVWASIGDSADDAEVSTLVTAGEASSYVELERGALPPKSRTKETTLVGRAARAITAQLAEEYTAGAVDFPTCRVQREAQGQKTSPASVRATSTSPVREHQPMPTMPGKLVLLMATSTGVERSEVAA